MNDRSGGLRVGCAGDDRESARTVVRPFNRCVEVDSARLATRAAQGDSQWMLTRVAEAEAAARFAELLARAQAGETILVERDGVAVCRLGPPGPACTLDAFTRFLAELHAQGGVREVTDSPQRLA